MTKVLALTAALLLWPSAALAADPPPPPAPPPTVLATPMRVEKLPNGLTVVYVPFASPGVVSYFTLVRAGSRDEVEPGKSGYAHLFEHLMFRGTPRIPAHEYERRMQALGAENNAFTTSDFTMYTPTVATSAIADLIVIDADRFQHLAYTTAAYKDETGAVLGEYNKDASNPLYLMDEALHALAFTRHTYGHTTIGWKRDVQAMPAAFEYSRSFFKRFYTPDDCVVFVVGDFDQAKVSQTIRAEYEAWAGKRAETSAPVEPEQTAPRSRALTWKDSTAPRLLEGYRVPAAANLADTAALAVASALVLGTSGELYQRLVVKEQKLLELSYDVDDMLGRDPGLLPFVAKLQPATSFEEITSAVDAAFAEVGKGGASGPRVDEVRRHLVNELLLRLQTPGGVAIMLARWMALTGDAGSLQAFVDALSVVTPDDVARVARTYLAPSRRSVVTMTGPTAARTNKEAPR